MCPGIVWGDMEEGHICKSGRGNGRGRVRHRRRDTIKGAHGVHVTWKLVEGIPSLRQRHVIRELEECFRAAKARFGLDLVGYSVMGNHLHLVVGAKTDESLRQGLQGLGIRLAKAVNRLFQRWGKVFRERFFARVLKTKRAVYNALRYALQNARKHGIPIRSNAWDPYSSGRFHRETRCSDHPVIHPDPFTHPWLAVALRRLTPTDLPGPRNYA